MIAEQAVASQVQEALTSAESWLKDIDLRPSPAVARHVAIVLAAEVRRLRDQAADAGHQAGEANVLNGLNFAQFNFMRGVEDDRATVADYLRRGVDVYVIQNIEVPEVAPFVLVVAESPGFWIECFDTPELARELATKIGLRVIDREVA